VFSFVVWVSRILVGIVLLFKIIERQACSSCSVFTDFAACHTLVTHRRSHPRWAAARVCFPQDVVSQASKASPEMSNYRSNHWAMEGLRDESPPAGSWGSATVVLYSARQRLIKTSMHDITQITFAGRKDQRKQNTGRSYDTNKSTRQRGIRIQLLSVLPSVRLTSYNDTKLQYLLGHTMPGGLM